VLAAPHQKEANVEDERLPFVSQGGFITSGEREEALAEDLQAERNRRARRERLAAHLDLDLDDPVDAQEFEEREAGGDFADGYHEAMADLDDSDDEDW
jgi:class 3 adenylate cyclase